MIMVSSVFVVFTYIAILSQFNTTPTSLSREISVGPDTSSSSTSSSTLVETNSATRNIFDYEDAEEISRHLREQVIALNGAVAGLKMEVNKAEGVMKQWHGKGSDALDSPAKGEDEDTRSKDKNDEEQEMERTANKVAPLIPHPAYLEGNPPICTLKPSPEAPLPVVLITLGRSGSSSTWQVMGELTGKVTRSVEHTGKNSLQSSRFFSKIDPGDNGNWMLGYMCYRQSKYPDAGVVGFKWKPHARSFFSHASQDALRTIAYSHSPQIKVVRSRRNLLDVIISMEKHRIGRPNAHCAKDDEDCIKKHLALGTGLILPTKNLQAALRRKKKEEDDVDRLLEELGVPHIKVSFEKLYYSDDAEEWMRIFRFLGVGPTEALTREQVQDAMAHAATHNPLHNVTLGNYHEVRECLVGTEFESMLR